MLGSYTVSVLLDFKGIGRSWVSSVYGPCESVQRSTFLEELVALGGLCFPRWIVGGDFNMVRRSEERVGNARGSRSMCRFEEFIRESELFDPQLTNARFTWMVGGSRNAASRIDRFLCSNELAEEFPNFVQEVLPRPCSDHFPLLLTSKQVSWGPTPFRYENMWSSHPILSGIGGVR